MSPSSNQGVLPGQEGLILQRGGEELRLEKVEDRLTTRLVSPEQLATVRGVIQPLSIRPVARGQLIEWKVPAARLDPVLDTVRQRAEVAFASHVYRLEMSPQSRFYLLDRLTVQFMPSLGIVTVDAIASALGLIRDKALDSIDNAYVFKVSKTAQENPIKLANRLMREPQVLLAEPNIVIETEALYRPKDTLYREQWHLNHQGGSELAKDSHISVEAAWEITRGSRSVVVAVTDDAFDLNHPDLQGAGKIVAPRDLKARDGLPMPSQDYENHGTAVAGVAIAEETGNGVVGVAPGCSLMPIQTTGFLDDESIEELFDWAVEQGASVISCSWSPATTYFPLSIVQRNAITRAATKGRNGKGCVVLFSAGNANRPLSGKVQEQGWPRNLLRGVTDWLGGFAIHPDVITVSACTSLNRKAIYSNWGNHVSVTAPSNNAPPSMSLPEAGQVETGPPVNSDFAGRGIVTSDRTGSKGYGRGDYTYGFGGTSSACPLVAGVVGLMLSANPDLEAWEVKKILQDTADKIVDNKSDPQLGVNYGTYDSKGHSLWFGYGKVNAHKAVKTAQERQLKSRHLSDTVSMHSSVTLSIPDDVPSGQLSTLMVKRSGRLQDIQVYVEIEHEFLGDVSVTLLSPQGSAILLQGRTLGRQTRLRQTYNLTTTPALRSLLNQAVQGRWQLRVVDHAPENTGQLNQWQLVLGI
ncbi:MAG: S8 family serine peptidase [Cyanobacteria bacterium P01_D01_bin.44]